MIGRLSSVVIDCSDPHGLAHFFPQQFHLDIRVADIDAAEAQVLALGAARLPSTEPGFRVYADPAGHPFCLEWE